MAEGLVTRLQLAHRSTMDLGNLGKTATRKDLLAMVGNFIAALSSGAKRGDMFELVPNVAANMCRAFGVWAVSSGSGTIGAILNGISLTTTWATSDQNSANLALAVINASVDARIANLFEAGPSKKATIALSSVAAGDVIDIWGYRFTATNGVTGNIGDFDMSGTNTQDAAALAAAINAYPGLNEEVCAYNNAANCFLYQRSTTRPVLGSPVVPAAVIVSPSTHVTITDFTNDPSFAISAKEPGALGNGVTFDITGTGVTQPFTGTASGDSVKRLASGAGGAGTRYAFTL